MDDRAADRRGREQRDEGQHMTLSFIGGLGVNPAIRVLSGYLCSITVLCYDLPIRAGLADKGQSELRGLIKANQRGTK